MKKMTFLCPRHILFPPVGTLSALAISHTATRMRRLRIHGCNAKFRKHQVQRFKDLGEKETVKNSGFGVKLDQIVEHLKLIKDDKAIIFVQDDYLVDEVERCLGKKHRIASIVLPSFDDRSSKAKDKPQSTTGRVKSGSEVAKNISLFQKENSEYKVLIISLNSNHVTGL